MSEQTIIGTLHTTVRRVSTGEIVLDELAIVENQLLTALTANVTIAAGGREVVQALLRSFATDDEAMRQSAVEVARRWLEQTRQAQDYEVVFGLSPAFCHPQLVAEALEGGDG